MRKLQLSPSNLRNVNSHTRNSSQSQQPAGARHDRLQGHPRRKTASRAAARSRTVPAKQRRATPRRFRCPADGLRRRRGTIRLHRQHRRTRPPRRQPIPLTANGGAAPLDATPPGSEPAPPTPARATPPPAEPAPPASAPATPPPAEAAPPAVPAIDPPAVAHSPRATVTAVDIVAHYGGTAGEGPWPWVPEAWTNSKVHLYDYLRFLDPDETSPSCEARWQVACADGTPWWVSHLEDRRDRQRSPRDRCMTHRRGNAADPFRDPPGSPVSARGAAPPCGAHCSRGPRRSRRTPGP